MNYADVVLSRSGTRNPHDDCLAPRPRFTNCGFRLLLKYNRYTTMLPNHSILGSLRQAHDPKSVIHEPLEQLKALSLTNLTIIKYNGARSNQGLFLSPGYQYFPLSTEVEQKVNDHTLQMQYYYLVASAEKVEQIYSH